MKFYFWLASVLEPAYLWARVRRLVAPSPRYNGRRTAHGHPGMEALRFVRTIPRWAILCSVFVITAAVVTSRLIGR